MTRKQVLTLAALAGMISYFMVNDRQIVKGGVQDRT